MNWIFEWRDGGFYRKDDGFYMIPNGAEADSPAYGRIVRVSNGLFHRAEFFGAVGSKAPWFKLLSEAEAWLVEEAARFN